MMANLLDACRLEMAKEAEGRLQVRQLPSSQLRSGLDQRDATKASFPIADRVPASAPSGRPEP